MSDQKTIYEYLVVQARILGIVPVRKAADQFLKLGLKAIVVPTKRRSIPKAWVEAAWRKQGGRCAICKKPLALDEAAGDHVDPHNLNGEHTKRNIVAVHGVKSEVNCNSVKGGRDLFSESKRRGELINSMLPKIEVESD